MIDKLRVAVVGCGIGRSHLTAYRALPDAFTVQAICDIDPARTTEAAEEFSVRHVVGDFAELLRRDDIDVVDLCTPSHLHKQQICKALAAGKHVICEKPVAGSLKEIDDLKAAEQQAGRRVMPIFQYRYGHGLQKLRMLMSEGAAGKAYLATVEVAWRRRAEYYGVDWRGKWKTELGGVLLTHAIHALDMLCYICGPASRVFARTVTRVNPIEVEDCAAVSLEMADGSLASVSATLGSSEEITRHRFCFERLCAESNTRPYTNSGDPWRFIGDTPDATAKIESILANFGPEPEGYEGQFAHFAEALAAGKPPPVTLDDARITLELISAMYYSSRMGKPVELPIGFDHPVYSGWAPRC